MNFEKKLQYDFPKMRGGEGQRPFGIFPKIHLYWYCHPSLRLTSDRWMTWPLSLDTSARSSDKGGRGKKVVAHLFIEISGFS